MIPPRHRSIPHSATRLVFASFALALALGAQSVGDPAYQLWRQARDRQDLPSLHGVAAKAEAGASDASPKSLYAAALARSFEAEIALELGKKGEAAAAAEAGIALARRLVAASPAVAEHRRLLGTLCGQVIPANLMSALQYGRCAREEIDAALRLDPKSAWGYLGRGVGNYYLPEAFGGGIDKAIRDFRQANSLDPNLADSWLWLGIALRKNGDHSGARAALSKARSLAPSRIWIQRQLEKTPR
ncbi:MAG: tetratricopeptide repeat protein [Bryobacterales bacterium]|nr:tetratricopeptide repeat protein [Bryobacterales bacterium]